MKKGEMSIQVLVIVILALIVLVVIASIFVSKMRAGNEEISSCASKGGECIIRADCSARGGFPTNSGNCEDDANAVAGSICCLMGQEPFN